MSIKITIPKFYKDFSRKRVVNFIENELEKEDNFNYKKTVHIIYKSIADIENTLNYMEFIDKEREIRCKTIYEILKELKDKCSEAMENKYFKKEDLKFLLSIFK